MDDTEKEIPELKDDLSNIDEISKLKEIMVAIDELSFIDEIIKVKEDLSETIVLSDAEAGLKFKLKDDNVYYPTQNALKNYHTLKKGHDTMEMKLADVIPGNRTLVVVYGSDQSSSEFKERAARLIGSLNMAETIKAVVITVNGERVFRGLDFSTPPNDGTLDEKLYGLVKERFTQVVEVKNGA